MGLTVYQSISVHYLNIGSVSNSSVLQIGTAGKINAISRASPLQEAVSPKAQAEPPAELPVVPLPAAAKLSPGPN
ncbi:spore germination protein GerPB [Paenibacillus donghaensis]|uniref:Uncharacterized protein n=1 Tax=Paenibacillus donghaensis TaxID=414771 RepID=A0A2Z2KRV9_9BACL|nr:spore germination protein GerPB [Paenibacillus donghaensis]ASA21778.1 hypothetical protein B9T62_13960 [Paenibacillus donghaensis]